MAIALVTSGNSSGSGNTLSVTGVTAAAGSILAITVLGVITGNTALTVASASGGAGNVYNIPAGAQAASYFSSQNQYAVVATIWCQVSTALSSATVTVTFTGAPGFTEATWASYSGVAAGAGTVGASSTAFLTTPATAASPSVTAGATNLVIAVCSVNGVASAVSNSYALLADDFSAWLGTTGAGSTSTTFTLTSTPPVWATTITAIGPTGVTGTGSVAIPKPSVAAAGYMVPSGTGSVAIPKPRVAAAGTFSGSVTGTGSVAIPKPSVAASGYMLPSGTGSVAIPKPRLAAAGTFAGSVTGTGSVAIPKPSVAAAGSAPAGFDALPVAPTFPDTPLGGTVELQLNGVWTDVTSYVNNPDGITIGRGHPDESTTASPSAAGISLINDDARFTSKNPAGPYYPYLGRNTPLRTSVPEGASYLRSETDQASYAQCPDSAGISITGDMDVQIDVTLGNWNSDQVLAGKWATTGNERTWLLFLHENGTVVLNLSTNGTGIDSAASNALLPLPPLQRMCIRATLTSSTGTVTFYTSPPGLSSPSWTQLGTPRSFGGTSLTPFNSTAPLQVGYGTDTDDGLPGIYGKIHAFQLLSGIGGTAKASPDFTAQTPGTTSFTDAQGNTWTLEGTAEISSRKYRLHAECSEWPQSWDPTGHDVQVAVAAAGVLRRLSAAQNPVNSAMFRAWTRQGSVGGTLAPVAYWPGEDGAAATQVASGIGGPPMAIVGSPTMATDSSFAGSGPLPQMNGGMFSGPVPAYTSHGSIIARFLMNVQTGPGNGARIMRVVTTGTVAFFALYYTTGGGLGLAGYDVNGTQVFDTGAFAFGILGKPCWVSMELQPAGGSTVDYSLVVLQPGANLAFATSGSYTGSIGVAQYLIPAPTQALGAVTLGQFSVQSAWESLFTFASPYEHTANLAGNLAGPLDAWQAEPAGVRIQRLCTEEGIAFRGRGNLADTVLMGTQTLQTLDALLQECADADRGVMYEPRQVLGLGYRTRATLGNQSVAVPLDFDQPGVAFPMSSTEDDQVTINDVTVTQTSGGSFARQQLLSGRLSVQPPPAGIGRYDTQVTRNLANDSQLNSQAGWELRTGTVDDSRYPGVSVDLASREAAVQALYYAFQDADLGDYVTIANPPPWLPAGPVRQLIQATSETLYDFRYLITWTGIPELPWDVGIASDPVYGHADTAGSQLNAGITSTAATMAVVPSAGSGSLWTTAGADFPFDVLVAGEQMTVTAITSATSPQTFHVTRSVNGVVKAQVAGAAVSLAYPMIIALGGN